MGAVFVQGELEAGAEPPAPLPAQGSSHTAELTRVIVQLRASSNSSAH